MLSVLYIYSSLYYLSTMNSVTQNKYNFGGDYDTCNSIS